MDTTLNYVKTGDITVERMLKELGEEAAKRNGIKPKDARRGIQKFMKKKKATYEDWLHLYNDTFCKMARR